MLSSTFRAVGACRVLKIPVALHIVAPNIWLVHCLREPISAIDYKGLLAAVTPKALF